MKFLNAYQFVGGPLDGYLWTPSSGEAPPIVEVKAAEAATETLGGYIIRAYPPRTALYALHEKAREYRTDDAWGPA